MRLIHVPHGENLIFDGTLVSTIRALHGDVSQNERAMTLEQFRSGKVRTLIATDVASRGLDIPGVDLVVNFRVSDFSLQFLLDGFLNGDAHVAPS